MTVAEILSVFQALSSLPALQMIFGLAVAIACLIVFLRQKPASPVATSSSGALPGISDPAMYFQGPQQMMVTLAQMRDLQAAGVEKQAAILDEQKEQTHLLTAIERRQEAMRLEAVASAGRAARRPPVT